MYFLMENGSATRLCDVRISREPGTVNVENPELLLKLYLEPDFLSRLIIIGRETPRMGISIL